MSIRRSVLFTVVLLAAAALLSGHAKTAHTAKSLTSNTATQDPGSGPCAPACRYVCEQGPECPATCKPICKPPNCKIQCDALGPATCQVDCQKASCQIECGEDFHCTEQCPPCQNVCEEPQCAVKCEDPKPVCKPVCEDPYCEWECAKPQNCPIPKCRMQCDQVHSCHNQCCPCSSVDNASFAIELAARAEKHSSITNKMLPTPIEIAHEARFMEKQNVQQCCPCANQRDNIMANYGATSVPNFAGKA